MATMRFSVPDWCCFPEGAVPEEYYRQLRACGVTAAEMVAPQRWAAARDAGLALCNLPGPGMTKGLNRREHHAELLPQLRDAICTAQQAGIPAVIVFSGNREELTDEEGIANCAAGLRELAPLAEEAGVTLLFEMLNAVDHAGYQADRSAFGFAVARAVASPAVKVLYDIYHMHRMGEDLVGDLLANLDLIGHIHVADSPCRVLPAPGGEIDYSAIVQQVMAAGYAGYWGLEFLPRTDALDEIARSVAYLNSIAQCAQTMLQ